MKNQFELEQKILSCWGITSDIELLCKQVLDKGITDPDYLANFLLGLKTIYDTKFEDLFEEFEETLKVNK